MSKQTPKQQSLCNNKFDGLMNAAPHKRYKSFAATVADWESVWLDCDPNQPLPDEGVISVWPEEIFRRRIRPVFAVREDANRGVRVRFQQVAEVMHVHLEERQKLDGYGGGRFAGGRAGRARTGGVRAWRMDDWFAGRM